MLALRAHHHSRHAAMGPRPAIACRLPRSPVSLPGGVRSAEVLVLSDAPVAGPAHKA